jgi:hypothetical protein
VIVINTARGRRIPTAVWLAVPMLLFAALAAACGGGTKVEPEPDPEPESSKGAEPGVVLTPPPDATPLNVTLAEFSITPAGTTVPRGEIYVLAENAGAEAHEVAIIRSTRAPDALPTDDAGRVLEDEVDLAGEIEPFASGTSASRVFTLTPGSYVLICNILGEEGGGKVESHYREGMRAALTVQ